jgi:hypothetical protein
MAHAHQAGHRLHVSFLPAGAATLQAQTQRFGLAFYLAAANGAPRLEALGVIQAIGVLGEVCDEALCWSPAAPKDFAGN